MNCFADRSDSALPITLVRKADRDAWVAGLEPGPRAWVERSAAGPLPRVTTIPRADGSPGGAVLEVEDDPGRADFAALVSAVGAGTFAFEPELAPELATRAALGWALASYRYTRFKQGASAPATLVWPAAADRDAVRNAAEAIAFGRDLVNDPASALGPVELADRAEELAREHGARFERIVGGDLLVRNFPLVHAVGRASSRPPALVDLVHGDESHPKVTLVGKGVVFDTGGLSLKPNAAMVKMKKDMGGAASVLALAKLILCSGLPVRLRVLVPCVENSVSANAYRPQDILTSRKGLTVEITNTDAEGRLVLADALTEADAEQPDLLIDVATLTGAARVALGTELPGYFTDDEALAGDLAAACRSASDPLWRMPLHRGYSRFLESQAADLVNAAMVPEGGAITAALFLSRFVEKTKGWVHVDAMCWNNDTRPGHPAGGEVAGVLAFHELLRARYGR